MWLLVWMMCCAWDPGWTDSTTAQEEEEAARLRGFCGETYNSQSPGPGEKYQGDKR